MSDITVRFFNDQEDDAVIEEARGNMIGAGYDIVVDKNVDGLTIDDIFRPSVHVLVGFKD